MKSLTVENFKSIEHLELDCRRVNVFIGKPGTGKSNILESIGLLSYCYHSAEKRLDEFVRLEAIPDLFFEHEIERPLKIKFDQNILEIKAL